MAQPLQLRRVPLLFRHLSLLPSTVSPPLFLSISSKLSNPISSKALLLRQLSSTPYPLQYEMIVLLPPPPSPPPRRSSRNSHAPDSNSFEDFLENRLNPPPDPDPDTSPSDGLSKSQRQYLDKRRRRMLGSDSEDEQYRRAHANEMIELKPQIVEFETVHQREQELSSYDAFAHEWDKGRHYRMVYQLEKKYFPNQGFDRAFLHPGAHHADQKNHKSVAAKAQNKLDEGLLPFQDKDKKNVEDVKPQVPKKSVEEFFKCLMVDPTEEAPPEAFLSSRRTGLPAKWDSPTGTVLLVNKPKGWTSFTVCGKLRHLVKVKKVGHAGTLDPMATGLLIVCVGKSTKIVDRFQGMTKGYSGIFRLGEATSTWDADSPVIQREPWEHIKDADLKKAAKSFCGEIWQVPPMFSAIKVGGEKMYEKARRGENIELSPRRVSIFQFDIERSLDDRQNLIFRVTCSKGTYIRSLCADLGKALGSCAHLTALRRDSIGEYLADDAWEFKELEEDIIKGYI